MIPAGYHRERKKETTNLFYEKNHMIPAGYHRERKEETPKKKFKKLKIKTGPSYYAR
jgi:hypothetical protein